MMQEPWQNNIQNIKTLINELEAELIMLYTKKQGYLIKKYMDQNTKTLINLDKRTNTIQKELEKAEHQQQQKENHY